MNERRTVDFREGVRPILGRLLRPESLLVAPRTHLTRRSAERRIAKFCDVVLAGLTRPIPSDPDNLFAVLRADVEQRFNADRGRSRTVLSSCSSESSPRRRPVVSRRGSTTAS